MPYIRPVKREFFARLLFEINCIEDGELAYVLMMVAVKYGRQLGDNFDGHNRVLGVLENVKHEYQRRILDKYEDKKIEENGDIL